MYVGSDPRESQQAEVVEVSKPNASVFRWSSDLKSHSSMVLATYSAAQKAAWRPSISNDETCAVEASMHSSPSPPLSSPSQEPGSKYPTPLNQPGVSPPHRLRLPSLDSLPVTPDYPGATFATKRLTTNTDSYTTTYHRHSVAMRSHTLLSVCIAMEASAIELSPSARLFADSAKTPVCEYAGRDAEETDTGCEAIWSTVPPSKLNPRHSHHCLIAPVPFSAVALRYPGL